jgi:hypothetical protein
MSIIERARVLLLRMIVLPFLEASARLGLGG